jgi:hypothetical protein
VLDIRADRHSGLHVKCPLFLPHFNKNHIYHRSILVKLPNIVLNENPCSGSPVVTSSRRIQKLDIANLIIAFFGTLLRVCHKNPS